MRFEKDGWQIETAEAKGREIPEWAKDPVELEFPDTFFLTCFWKLHTERRFECGPIPRSEMRAYIKRFEIDGQILEDCIDIVALIDNFFLSYIAAERKRKQEKEQHQTMKSYKR